MKRSFKGILLLVCLALPLRSFAENNNDDLPRALRNLKEAMDAPPPQAQAPAGRVAPTLPPPDPDPDFSEIESLERQTILEDNPEAPSSVMKLPPPTTTRANPPAPPVALPMPDQEKGDEPPPLAREDLDSDAAAQIEALTPKIKELVSGRAFEVEADSTLMGKVVTAGHHAALIRKVHEIMNRLGIEGDVPSWTVRINASPIPNARMSVGTHLMELNLGLFAFCPNEDMLASVIAHEMTHNNRKQLQATKDSSEIEALLNSIPGFHSLEPRQREEIRADLGAIDRLIRAGYNPWAHYDFEKQVSEKFDSLQDRKFAKWIYKRLFDKDLDFMQDHPAPEVRMVAAKAYVAWRANKKDLSKQTMGYTPLTPSLKLLRWRTRPFLAAIESKNALRLAMLSVGLSSASALGWYLSKSDYEHLRTVGDTLRNAADAPITHYIMTGIGVVAGIGEALVIGDWVKEVYFDSAVNSKIAYAVDNSKDFLKGIRGTLEKLSQSHGPKDADYINQLETILARITTDLRSLDESVFKENPTEFALRRNGYTALHNDYCQTLAEAIKLGNQALLALPDADKQLALHALTFSLREFPSSIALNPVVKPELEKLFKPELEIWAQHRLIPRGMNNRTLQILALDDLSVHIDRKMTAPERLEVLEIMTKFRMYRPAREDLIAHLKSMIEYGINPTSNDATFLPRLGKVISELRERGDMAVSNKRSKLELDSLLFRTEREFADRPFEDRLALFSLSHEIPIAPVNHRGRINQEKLNVRDLVIKLRSFHSVKELRDYVEKELKPRGVILDNLSNYFYREVLAHPEWLQTRDDFDALIDSEHFWKKFNTADPGTLEGDLMNHVKDLAKKYPGAWRFEPAAAELMHRLILSRLKIMGIPFETQIQKTDIWRKLSERGVTSATDTLFAEIHSAANPSQKADLEKEALDGFVWEQNLKAEIAERQMRDSKEFKELLAERDPHQRILLLDEILGKLDYNFTEKGTAYQELLERLSKEIRSTEEESTLIHRTKTGKLGGNRQEDFGLRSLSSIVGKVHGWKLEDQWHFLLFLRGDVPPNANEEAAFRTIGPERIRRMYSVLPVALRSGLVDTMLEGGNGLTGPKGIKKDYPNRIVDYLLKDTDPKSRKIGHEMIDAFLFALDKTGNHAMKSSVLSYLLALPQSEGGSVGLTLKHIFEVFGPTGVKIGQFLVATELLPKEDNAILEKLQEKARIPSRHSIYGDLNDVTEGKKLPVELLDLLGAASIKHGSSARETQTMEEIVLKVLRLDAKEHTAAEFAQLEAMAEYLIDNHGAKYGIFRAMVRASRAAVEQELDLSKEVEKSGLARNHIYEGKSDHLIEVAVPREVLLSDRLIAAEFAKGNSISDADLPPEIRDLVARKILEIEGHNLFQNSPEPGLLYFDPDRHPGNFRVFYNPATGKIILSPIDHGQLHTYTAKQRDQFFDLFSLAQVVRQGGSSHWAAKKAAEILELDSSYVPKIREALGNYFPSMEFTEPTSYFALLSALSDAGFTPPILYFDLLRGIIQLKQYERHIKGDIPLTPRGRLVEVVTPRARAFGQEFEDNLSMTEKLGIGLQPMTKPLNNCLRGYRRFLRSTFKRAA